MDEDRIFVQGCYCGIAHGQSAIQPCEGLIGIAAECVDVGNVKRRVVRIEADDFRQLRLPTGIVALRKIDHRQRNPLLRVRGFRLRHQ